MGSISVSGDDMMSFSFRAQPCFVHEPSHSFASYASSPILQLNLDTWATISAPMAHKDLPNLLSQLSIFSLVLTGRTLTPGVKAALRDSKNIAHDFDAYSLGVLEYSSPNSSASVGAVGVILKKLAHRVN